MEEETNLNHVTKLGAYGLGAFTAFAVALALLVSVSSTPTAEAATVELPDRRTTVGKRGSRATRSGSVVNGALAHRRASPITGRRTSAR